MRRSDRLSQIIEIVQDGRLHLARDLAARLEVSVRTIYRDVDTLVASGIPIDGERGVGYMLREPVFLPPMNLSLMELEALHLGMAIVAEAADPELQLASVSLASKIAKVASARGTVPRNWGFGVYPFAQARAGFKHMPKIRAATRNRTKLEIDYVSLDGQASTRLVRPLEITYWGRVWTLSAWCEKRNDFRVLRIDRMERCEATSECFDDEPGRNLEDYLAQVNAEMTGTKDG
ncbi:predicted DNA-binding transcriptional regulator YafY [Hoeflea halophila]|uniref:Predicted DNA-binding transcriptional regulator YafY n=1 Tax=Hoeflea halophila TaxID=714899 RepID=A0A286IBI3_9HYPH|nr:YafY family protein [Hoeflea halophila]SOE17488.1 predicted DNA-binding transcriptional regulator YafY [Hoeflea halophila]